MCVMQSDRGFRRGHRAVRPHSAADGPVNDPREADVRGPVIYSQTRLGQCGRPFTIYKIRTMLPNCEATTGPRWSTADGPRITPVGQFLRRAHLDELPQLWNILRGEMSLVGPRPERPEFVTQLEQAIPCYRERLAVRPGVTGMAQIQLRTIACLAVPRRGALLRSGEHRPRAVRVDGRRADRRPATCREGRALGIPVRAMGMRPGVPDPRGVVRLARLLHRERPQVVQTWMDHSNLIGGVAARLAARAPVIWGVHHANHIPRLTKGTTLMTVSAWPGCPGGSPPGSFAAPNRSGRRTRGGASRRSG